MARLRERRRFIQQAAAGSTIAVLGGLYYFGDDWLSSAHAQARPDGRPRLPPGQRRIQALKPMGGAPGDPRRSQFRLKIHGAVDNPMDLDFAALSKLGKIELSADVHCVTGWSLFDSRWVGARLKDLAARAKVQQGARYVIFEAAHGYTANIPLRDALEPNVLIAHSFNGHPIARAHGAPVRAIVPDLYFWKSAKWLTGVRFSKRDEPGYWERRGYHNPGDPWREERYG